MEHRIGLSMIARLGAIALSPCSVVAPTRARAQGIAYSFTRIADTLAQRCGPRRSAMRRHERSGHCHRGLCPRRIKSHTNSGAGTVSPFTQVATSLASTVRLHQ